LDGSLGHYGDDEVPVRNGLGREQAAEEDIAISSYELPREHSHHVSRKDWHRLIAALRAIRTKPQRGRVVGNIVSEWGQILGLVLMRKRLMEVGSKER
jgi:hypothetical protein